MRRGQADREGGAGRDCGFNPFKPNGATRREQLKMRRVQFYFAQKPSCLGLIGVSSSIPQPPKPERVQISFSSVRARLFSNFG